MPTPRMLAVAALTLLLGACAGTPRRAAPWPGPTSPVPPPPSANVPDAVPRAEPRSSHGNPPFYDVNGQRYTILASADNFVERGVASWYGPDFHGHNTSSGEVYDMYAMTAAHRTLPIPCYARVTNLSNGRSVVVRINDRGPFVANRIIDLSYSAASRLDIVRTGTAFVELRTIGPGDVGAAAPTAPTAPTGSPVADAASATIAPSPPATVALYIQIGAFADPANAQRVLDRLQSNGVAHVFSVANDSSGRTLRRVRIGPIATVEEFDALAARLATLGYPEARLAND
ncbi:MAG: septal ring lytic transglycosylase RlpA family protein [Proteobacteria bacterium]|nr:septal ring lytic transglycosylase RlpA family protein [Pseudomonadota bacterium]